MRQKNENEMERRNNKENLERYPGGGGIRMDESRLESINSCELEF